MRTPRQAVTALAIGSMRLTYGQVEGPGLNERIHGDADVARSRWMDGDGQRDVRVTGDSGVRSWAGFWNTWIRIRETAEFD